MRVRHCTTKDFFEHLPRRGIIIIVLSDHLDNSNCYIIIHVRCPTENFTSRLARIMTRPLHYSTSKYIFMSSRMSTLICVFDASIILALSKKKNTH